MSKMKEEFEERNIDLLFFFVDRDTLRVLLNWFYGGQSLFSVRTPESNETVLTSST